MPSSASQLTTAQRTHRGNFADRFMDELLQELATLITRSPCRVVSPDTADGSTLLRSTLGIREEDFLQQQQDERAALISPFPATPLIALLENLKIDSFEEEMLYRETIEHSYRMQCTLALRSGFSSPSTWCAVHVFGASGLSAVLLFQLATASMYAAHELVTRLGTLAGLDMQIYRPPMAVARQPDIFWGEQWHEGVSTTEFPQYEIYRQVIDGLIEAAIREHCIRDVVQQDGGEGISKLHVLEVCAGDGALAERLLTNLGECLASYTLLERNAQLAGSARQRLAGSPAASVCQGDAADARAYGELGCDFSLCISAGSVLCSQVGRSSDAERVLALIASSLVDGGTLIATGISNSFLQPALLQRAGFQDVVRGSYPSALAQCTAAPGGLEHGWGRFQFFVLRKVVSAQQVAGKDALFCALASTSLPGEERPELCPSKSRRPSTTRSSFSVALA